MGAVIVVWLVFSVLKKLIGLAILAGLALAGFVLWQNPQLQSALLAWIRNVFG